MRTERTGLISGLMAVLLAVLISFSGVMCLNDAFSLRAAPWPLLTVCCCVAVLAALSGLPKRSWPFDLLAAAVYLGVLIWKHPLFTDSLQTVIYAATSEYVRAFDAMRVVGTAAGDPQWFLMAAAAPLAWLTARIIGREGSAVPVLLAVLPIMVPVLLVVDLAPVLWLILLTGGLLVVVVSHSVRERSRTEGAALAWWLVLPAIILICAITVLWPPADYVRADWSETLRSLTQNSEQVTERVETWTQAITLPRVQWSRELKTVDLKKIGPKQMTGQPVLKYRSDSAIRYLRGVSLAMYEDNAWNALPTEEYEVYAVDANPQLNSAVMVHTLEIATQTTAPQLYTTYYLAAAPEGGVLLDDAYVANAERRREYQVLFEPSLQYPLGTAETADRLAAEVYTRMPEELRPALEALLEENGLTAGSAEAISSFVKGSGVYDLNTPGIPDGEEFVLYFLQQSHRGYCVHFASAAVLLLRTAGIPARYVTGYAVSGTAGQWSSVTEDDAHAWVEYYTPGLGWRPLDPTPAEEEQQTQSPVEPDQPEVSEPEKQPEIPEREPMQVPQAAPEAVRELPRGLLWLAVVPCLVLVVLLRRWCGLRYRLNRCRKGHPNRRAMACWRWLVQLSRADGTQIEEELLCLAEKARFSQHTMSDDEIAALWLAIEARIRQLKAAPAGKRLWWRYGLTLF